MSSGYNTLNAWPMAMKLAWQVFNITVTSEGEARLVQASVHCESPLRLSKLPFSRKNMR
jgi:hypothetical protein